MNELYDLGYVALLLAFALALYGATVAVLGAQTKHPAFVESARNAALAIVPLLTLDLLLLVYALVALDLRLAYVYDVSSAAMSWFLRVTAIWGAAGAGAVPWIIKAATLDGRDVADLPFDVRPQEDLTGLVVTFVPPAQLSGTLHDGAGRPTSDLSMILFPTDRALWFQGSRRLRQPVQQPGAIAEASREVVDAQVGHGASVGKRG